MGAWRGKARSVCANSALRPRAGPTRIAQSARNRASLLETLDQQRSPWAAPDPAPIAGARRPIQRHRLMGTARSKTHAGGLHQLRRTTCRPCLRHLGRSGHQQLRRCSARSKRGGRSARSISVHIGHIGTGRCQCLGHRTVGRATTPPSPVGSAPSRRAVSRGALCRKRIIPCSSQLCASPNVQPRASRLLWAHPRIPCRSIGGIRRWGSSTSNRLVRCTRQGRSARAMADSSAIDEARWPHRPGEINPAPPRAHSNQPTVAFSAYFSLLDLWIAALFISSAQCRISRRPSRVLRQRGQALHPVAIGGVQDTADVAHLSVVNVAADHAPCKPRLPASRATAFSKSSR